MERRKYELADRMEKKTWEVQRSGASVTTRYWARKGAAPRIVTKKCESEDEAKKHMDRLVDEREAQGYVLFESDDDKATSATDDGEGRELAAAIVEKPDEVDAYLVYGDWLATRGDPLGELVAVQARLADEPRDRALRAKQAELFEKHARAWLGPLADEEGFDGRWRWGFLEAVELGVDEPCSMEAPLALDALLRAPTARFLRELTFGDFGEEEELSHGEMDYGDLVAALGKAALPPTLRRLVFAPKRVRLGNVASGDVTALLARLRGLEDLSLKAGTIKLTAIDLPELRRIHVETRSPSRALVRALVGARWTKLESFVLSFGRLAGEATLADLSPLLAGTATPAVTHLGLPRSPFTDDLVARLLDAPILGRIKSLDLSGGTLTQAGARALIAAARSLAHLDDLDLSGTALPRGVVVDLKSTFGERLFVDEGEVEADDDDDDDHYDEIVE
jgi:uncharacterized protein (TIGR02996 family)